LRLLQAFVVWTDNNKFGYAYIVNKESDLTPAVDTDLEPMDHYIHDMVIVNLMCSVFEDVVTLFSWELFDGRDTVLAVYVSFFVKGLAPRVFDRNERTVHQGLSGEAKAVY
jgi:hypothetical protein